MNNETSKTSMVAMPIVVARMGDFCEPIRAKLPGTLSRESLLSYICRFCKSNDHSLNVKGKFPLTLTMTTIRGDVGLSPDPGEGPSGRSMEMAFSSRCLRAMPPRIAPCPLS
jgi:hypothetical protein